jgi:CheY-like chemotaxis protein
MNQPGALLFAGRTLLVADESPYYQTVLSLTFADEGMTVAMAGDGLAALKKLEQFTPDLIIASLSMPGLDGYELCRAVKEDERFSHIPVMLLVGLHESFDQAEARRAGADDVVTKPFKSIRQLVGRVGSLLGGNGADNAAGGFSTLGLGSPEVAASEIETPGSENNSMTEPNVPVFVEAPLMDDHEMPEEPLAHACVADMALQTADTQKLDPIDNEPEAEMPIEYAQADTRELPRVSEPPIDGSIVEDSARSGEAQPVEAQTAIETTPVSTVNDSDLVAPGEQPAMRITSEMNEPSMPQTEPSATPAVFNDSLLELEDFDNAPPSAIADDLVLDLDFEVPAIASTFSVNESFAAPATPTLAPVRIFDVEPEVESPSLAAEESHEPAAMIDPTEEVSAPVVALAENPVLADQVSGLSAEAVDAIARRVVEQLSEKVVREIAWEVVPELAELLIKQKLAEEK